MSETNKKNYFDYGLLFIIFLFMIVSCIGIYSAQKDSTYHENFVIKQFIWYVVGLSISIVIYYFDFEQIKKLSLYVYLAGNFTLVVLHFSPDSIAPVTVFVNIVVVFNYFSILIDWMNPSLVKATALRLLAW